MIKCQKCARELKHGDQAFESVRKKITIKGNQIEIREVK